MGGMVMSGVVLAESGSGPSSESPESTLRIPCHPRSTRSVTASSINPVMMERCNIVWFFIRLSGSLNLFQKILVKKRRRDLRMETRCEIVFILDALLESHNFTAALCQYNHVFSDAFYLRRAYKDSVCGSEIRLNIILKRFILSPIGVAVDIDIHNFQRFLSFFPVVKLFCQKDSARARAEYILDFFHLPPHPLSLTELLERRTLPSGNYKLIHF